MERGYSPHSSDDEEKEHEHRRPRQAQPPPPSQSLKSRLVDRLKGAGIRGYEVTHNTLFDLREKHARTDEDRRAMAFEEMARLAQGTRRDAAPTDPGADGSGAQTPGWKHHGSTPPSVEECWELVSRRGYLTDYQVLRMCHPLFRTHGWIEDKERVVLIGKRWSQLIKDRVLRVALARRVSPDKAAHDLDEQLRHFFAGGSKVETGQLSALLDEAINDVTASARSGADPLTRDSVIGGSRQNRQNQQNQ